MALRGSFDTFRDADRNGVGQNPEFVNWLPFNSQG